MKRLFFVLLMCFFNIGWTWTAGWDTDLPEGITFYTVATLPSSPSVNDLAGVTDGSGVADCTVGGGSNQNICVWSGSAWVIIGDGGGSSPLTTKGDVWGYSTVDARIPVGANGQLLQADSTQTLGVKWATIAGSGDVTAASNLGDNLLIRGDGAGKGVQNSGITVNDSDVITGANGITIDTPTFHVDPVNSYIGMGTTATNTQNQLHFLMSADKDILIDGTTNPRTIDTGVIRFEQTPSIENTRAVTINLDVNSQASTHGHVVNITATALAAGETATAYDINVDRSTSTGGVVRGFEMSIAGSGSAIGHLLHADPEIVPLTQFSGAFVNIEQAWDENGGFLDVTTAFNSSGTDVTLFNTNGDMVHIGMDAGFNEIEVNLDTFAGGAGIKPVFEYSSGGGTPVWTVFTPQDETQGFRQTGLIDWDIDDLVTPTWAVSTINSVSKFYIRITRTQASIPVDPIEDTIQVVRAIVYEWDENGRIFAGSITTGSKSNTVTTEGSAETSQMIAHINDSFSETIEMTLMRHSDTTENGAALYAIRSRGTHASQSVVQDNDILFWLRGEGHDGTDFNDAASIFFKVDGTPGANDMPGRIEFYTSPDGSNALAKRAVIDSTGLFTIEGLTASEIVATSASKGLVSLAVATYPSLTELSYVKGVTSAIQTQLDAEQHQICFIFDGGGSAVSTGEKLWVRAANSFTIGTAEVTVSPSGSCVVDIWKDTYANFPPTVADTITASAKPTVSGAVKSQDSTLTGWTTTITAGDYLLPNVDSCSTSTKVEVCLYE